MDNITDSEVHSEESTGQEQKRKKLKNRCFMVNWTTNEAPAESGNYLISVVMQGPTAQHGFYATAFYDQPSATWYKYDPFDLNYKPTEVITAKITGWASNIGIHLN